MLMRRKDVIMLRPEYEALGFGVWENVFPRRPSVRSDLNTRTRKARYVDGEVVLGRALCEIYINTRSYSVLVFGVNQPTFREHCKFSDSICSLANIAVSRCYSLLVGSEPISSVTWTKYQTQAYNVVNPSRSFLVPVDFRQFATLRFQSPERLIELSSRFFHPLSRSLANLGDQGGIAIEDVGS